MFTSLVASAGESSTAIAFQGARQNYSYFVDAEILADVSDYEGMQNINQGYLDIAEALELVPTDGAPQPCTAIAAAAQHNVSFRHFIPFFFIAFLLPFFCKNILTYLYASCI